MRPGDVLAYRRMLYDFSGDMLSYTSDDPGDLAPDVFADCRIATSPDSEAYYVTEDMAAVAIEAGRTMPRQDLLRSDLPSSSGFLLYDQPIGTWPRGSADNGEPLTVPVVGFAWLWEGPHDVWTYSEDMSTGEDPDRSPDGQDEHATVYPLGHYPALYPPMIPLNRIDSPIIWRPHDPPANDDGGLGRVLLATWTLMQQTITTSERGSGDRAERRRCQRAGLPLDVVIYWLRRKLAEKQDAGEEGAVPWSHRWLVSGYWQNHYNPGTGQHRYMWISGHVKGPEHLPLVVKDRVHAWVR